MQINLSPELEQYLQNKVGAGCYNDASEAVGAAIEKMREHDEKLDALPAAVKIGDQQIDYGESIPYTFERLEAITAKTWANAKLGKKINPDVIGQRALNPFSVG